MMKLLLKYYRIIFRTIQNMKKEIGTYVSF